MKSMGSGIIVTTRRAAALMTLLLLMTMGLFAAGTSSAQADEVEQNSFTLAVVGQDQTYIIEPVQVTYQEGQTLQQALEADGRVTFAEQALVAVNGIEPVNGSYMYTFTGYDEIEAGGSHMMSDIPASDVRGVFVTSSGVDTLGDGQANLVEQMGIYLQRTQGVQDEVSEGVRLYPAAIRAYTAAYEGLKSVGSADAQTLANNLADAMAAYDAIMAGPVNTVTFNVSGGATTDTAVFTVTDEYNNVWTVENGVVELPVAVRYTYQVFDADQYNGRRGTINLSGETQAGSQTIDVVIPTDNWFNTIDLFVGSKYSTATKLNVLSGASTDHSITYLVPDFVGPENQLGVYATAPTDITGSKLYVVYDGFDDVSYQYSTAYNSNSYKPAYLVTQGQTGTSFDYEIRVYDSGSRTEYQVEVCHAQIVRSATLSDLQVTTAGGQQLLGGYDAANCLVAGGNAYDVYTDQDELTITPTPMGTAEQGYTVHAVSSTDGVDITVPEGGSLTAASPAQVGDTPVTVTISTYLNSQSDSHGVYTVTIHRVSSNVVTLTHDADVTVEVTNQAGSSMPCVEQTETTSSYLLINGQTYTYTGTKNQWYHVRNTFTVDTSATIVDVPTPHEDDILSGVLLKYNNRSYEDDNNAYAQDESSTLHQQVWVVPDANATVWVNALVPDIDATYGDDGASLYTYAVSYTRQDTGASNSVTLKKGTDGTTKISRITGSATGLLRASGYGNTATLAVSEVATGDAGETYFQTYDIAIKRSLSLGSMSVGNGVNRLPMYYTSEIDSVDNPTSGFDRTVYDYTVIVPEGTQSVEVAYVFQSPTSSTDTSAGGYAVTLDGQRQEYEQGTTFKQTVNVNPTAYETRIPLRVSHTDASAQTTVYTITVRQMPRVNAAFVRTPSQTSINLIEDATGNRISANDDGTYTLIEGYTYTWSATCYGYMGQSGNITASNGLVVQVELAAVADNPAIDVSLTADWPLFRADAENNGVTGAATPISATQTVLYWAERLGEGYGSSAAGCPILVDDYLYTYAGDQIYKVDIITGQTVAQSTMVGTSSFAITPMTYAQGELFVALSNGRVEAFNAVTLEPLWVYTSPNGGQPNCPITYRDGYIYTGFWNFAATCDFVCLSITDEDPTNGADTTGGSSAPERKYATWTLPHAGGFYWAGAYAGEGFVLVGSDDAGITAGLEVTDEGKASGTMFMLDSATGEVLDSVTDDDYIAKTGLHVGNIRCTVVYDVQTDAYYYAARGGYLCSFKLGQDGRSIDHDSLRVIRLQNDATDGLVSATSTPVIYNGRAYVGADHGSYNQYDGQMVNVVDLSTNSVAYAVQMGGRAQSSALLTTAYAAENGEVYLYYFDNYAPGNLRYFVDRPGQTSAETHTVENGYNIADVLFSPQGAQAQYCICSPICDRYGTIYFKNDSAYMMAVGPTIESIEVTSLPTQTVYGVGDTFNPAGMQVIAHYSNGVDRDVTDYVSYDTEAFESPGTVTVPLVFEHVMYQADQADEGGQQVAKPTTSVQVTVKSELEPTIITSSIPEASVDSGVPYAVAFAASGTPHEMTWSLVGAPQLPEGITFDAATATLSGTPAQGTGGTYQFTISASNGVGDPATKSFELVVNESPEFPAWSKYKNLTAGEVGQDYSCTLQLKYRGYPEPITWVFQDGYTYVRESTGEVQYVSTMPDGLELNQITGVISGTPTTPGAYRVRIYARNGINGISTPYPFYLNVNGAPVIQTETLRDAAVGVNYSTSLSAVAYPTSITWSWEAAEGSQLPEGLELDASTGVISGSPTQAGTYQVVVTASNSYKGAGDSSATTHSSSKQLTLVVSSGATAPSITTTELDGAPVNQPYSMQLQASGTPTPLWSWEAADGSQLPEGLELDEALGTISGTPTVEGTYRVVITAANGVEPDAQAEFELVVGQAPQITTSQLSAAKQDEAYQTQLEATGSPAGTWSWEAAEGSQLPEGLELNADTGVISGTPTATGTYELLITIDNGVATDTASLQLVVGTVPQITTPSLPTAVQGQSYSYTVEATGYPDATLTCAGLSGGLKMTEDGTISGTPTQTANTTVTVTAANAVGSSSRSYTLFVVAPLQFVTQQLAAGFTGQPYTQMIQVQPADGVQSIQVQGLPQGLQFDEQIGTITGTPDSAGTYDVSITATGINAPDVQQTFELQVVQAPEVGDDLLATAMLTQPYQTTVQVSGGGTLSVQVTGLPDGLQQSFDATTGTLTISGTPDCAAGTYPITIQATSAVGQAECTDTRTASLLVVPFSQEPVVTTTALDPMIVGVRYDGVALAAVGIPDEFEWALANDTQLPQGLTLDGATGTISGTPAQPGSYEFDVTATNTVGTSPAQTVKLQINQLPVVTTTTLGQVNVGQAVDVQLQATAYPAVSSWSWQAADQGTDPQSLGLELNTATGQVTGAVDQPGRFEFDVRAGNTAGVSAVQRVTLEVVAPAVVVTQQLADGVVDQDYEAQLQATGYPDEFAWSWQAAEGSQLPEGLTLDSATGVISGQPQQVGDYQVVVNVSNGLEPVGSQQLALRVAQFSITGAQVQIDPSADLKYTGSAIEPALTVKLGDDELELGVDYEVVYTDNINAGQATATVKGIGNYGGEVQQQFQIVPAPISEAVVEVQTLRYTGRALLPTVTATFNGIELTAGVDYEKLTSASYQNNIDAGTDSATVTLVGTGNFTDSTDVPFSIDKMLVTFPQIQSSAYTGGKIKASVKPTTNYSVVENAGGVEPGDYPVVLQLTESDNHEWKPADGVTIDPDDASKATGVFTVTKRSNSWKVTPSINEWTYGQTPSTPKGTPAYGQAVFTYSTSKDGTFSAAQPTQAGSYYMCATVQETSNTAGLPTVLGPFRIVPANISTATVTADAQTYTGSALTPAVTVKLGSKTLKQGTDYTVKYADNVNAGTATITVTGTGNYTGTAKGTFAIGEPAQPETSSIAGATVTADAQAYTGSALTPAVTVKLGGKTLKQGTDYTVKYADNVNAGTATITVTGKGAYTGTAKGTFAIARVDVSDAAVTVAAQTYTGSALEPAVTVKLDGKTLKAGTDYTIAYANNEDVGTATVTVTGTDNYTGTAKATFAINPAADKQWTRLAGDDRLGTMQSITQAGYDSADTVLVTTGWGDADALTAAGLSGIMGAPIVSTAPGELSQQAQSEIQRLGAKRAIILGGTAAVSDTVSSQLKSMGLSVERLAGGSRLETAVLIWQRGSKAGEWGDTCILSKGWTSADALAAGSFSYANRAPIFLAMPDGTLTPETAAVVASFDHVVVLGGTAGDAAVKDSTVKSLGPTWMRIAGDTRYDTAVKLATWATGQDASAPFQPSVELSWQNAAVAFAWNYPDALVGVNVAGPKNSVTLLASTDADEFTQGVAAAVGQHADEVSHGYVLGGKAAIGDAVKALFEKAAK